MTNAGGVGLSATVTAVAAHPLNRQSRVENADEITGTFTIK